MTTPLKVYLDNLGFGLLILVGGSSDFRKVGFSFSVSQSYNISYTIMGPRMVL